MFGHVKFGVGDYAASKAGHMNDRPLSKQILGLVGWVAVTFIAAAAGTLASVQAASFYSELARPPWAPPASWFGPVWSVLYFIMALAAWIVWRVPVETRTRTPLALFSTLR